MNHSTIEEAFHWRYATQKFDSDREVSKEDWKLLEASLRLAPTSYGIQASKFLVVQNPELREKLKAVSYNQGQVTDSSVFIVFAYKDSIEVKDVDRYIQHIAKVREVPEESLAGFKSVVASSLVRADDWIQRWSQRQPYIAMGFLLETAAMLKIDACPMEGFDSAQYDQLLGLEGTGWKSVAAVAIGYRHAEDGHQHLKKVRHEAREVIQFV